MELIQMTMGILVRITSEVIYGIQSDAFIAFPGDYDAGRILITGFR